MERPIERRRRGRPLAVYLCGGALLVVVLVQLFMSWVFFHGGDSGYDDGSGDVLGGGPGVGTLNIGGVEEVVIDSHVVIKDAAAVGLQPRASAAVASVGLGTQMSNRTEATAAGVASPTIVKLQQLAPAPQTSPAPTTANQRPKAVAPVYKRIRPPPPPYFFPRYYDQADKSSPSTRPSAAFLTANVGAVPCIPAQAAGNQSLLCKYERESPVSCDVARSRCKWLPDCYEADDCSATNKDCAVKLVAVIPLQGGGTEFMRTMLKYRGLNLGGEADGPDGTVGWVTACDGTARAWNYSRAAMRNDGALARLHSRFKYIVHQVRHPLHQIRSNLAFCDPRDWQSWTSVWDFISLLSPGVEYRDPATGEYKSCLHRSMLYYLSWNRYVETVADYRINIEVPGADKGLCKQLLADAGPESMPPRVRDKRCELIMNLPRTVDRHSHGGFKRNTTWADVVHQDPAIAEQIALLAIRFGYPQVDFAESFA
eukprot:c46100_g1_i1.p1 GENE.c46100_g1_i1~~c46100_g1_i1.p1  ORF type:complete len:483 (+),score=75.52 c46100_g1_i1:105-1553(+)